ncbi:larval cuticle protein LCP-30-like [Cylas formicarius]|uniref:larval cuticle protein LCP-30-like n=1 Tax=Cylas formicarius TaxID=197179 RepID=UPI0029584BE0|nr:larval cuticle protein LCP-30-like [Cylas formicarius]
MMSQQKKVWAISEDGTIEFISVTSDKVEETISMMREGFIKCENIIAAVLVTACTTQRINRYVNSNFPSSFGKYQPVNPSPASDGNYYSGGYNANAGQQYVDNSGRYVHDPSGDYDPALHQYEGRYIHDNSGDYFPEKYGGIVGIGGNVGGQSTQNRFAPGVGTNGPASSFSAPGSSGAASEAAASEYVSQSGAVPVGYRTSASQFESASGSVSAGNGGQYDPSGSQNVVSGSAYSQSPVNYGKNYYDNARWKILRQEGGTDEDGYHYLYETENQIYGEEQGKVHNKGTNQEALRANGAFQYVGTDNRLYRVDYVADENGFQPAGEHLPTPPPVPEAIERSLAYQKSIGQI